MLLLKMSRPQGRNFTDCADYFHATIDNVDKKTPIMPGCSTIGGLCDSRGEFFKESLWNSFM